MRMPLLIWILHVVNLTKAQGGTKILRYRRNSSVGRLCPPGCLTCSALNGCLSCKPRLFFHLELDGMRQRGTCVSSCPRGHFGKRSPNISSCYSRYRRSHACEGCHEDCALCFSENFCTRCHPGYFLFRGKCDHSCPNGVTANTALRECTECSAGCEVCVKRNTCVRCRPDLYSLQGQCHSACPREFEPDVQLMQCLPHVHCEVGEWTDWGPCVWRRRLRAYRKGVERRTRQILQQPSGRGDPCPHLSEIKKCAIKKSPSRL